MPASRSARLNGRTLIVILLGLALQLTACGGGSGSAPTVANASNTPNANTGGDSDDDTDNDAGEDVSTPVNLSWNEPYQRDEEYPNTVNLPQQLITMRDGIRLAATVTLPADENGNLKYWFKTTVAGMTANNEFSTYIKK